MLTGLQARFTRLTRTGGAEIILLPDQKVKVTRIVLEVEKNNVRIADKKQYNELALADLAGIFEKDLPWAIALGGRGILHKKISGAGTDATGMIQAVLPNAKPSDFFIQNIESPKSNLLSLVRKEAILPLLDTLQEAGIYTTVVSLGGTAVVSVLPLIQAWSGAMSVSWAGHTLELSPDQEAIDYKPLSPATEETTIRIDRESLEAQYLLAYSAAFSLLTNEIPAGNFIPSVAVQKEEYTHKQLFKKLSGGILGFFLIVLMINFILFSSFSSQNNELLQKENRYSSMLTEMEKLGKEVKEKETFLSEAGWLQPSSISFYADRIASTVPASIKLTEFSVNPLNERQSREEKKEVFLPGTIVLKGECTRPTELNDWLDKIKKLKKIAKAKLVHYSFDNKEHKGTFSIEIETGN